MRFEPDFFKEENREGFIVPEMMKRAWSAAMEVLDVVSTVCDQIGVRYYACAGTLLGAVRHKGFIPCDDDIDICLLREDYLKFIELAPQYLPEGFVFSGAFANEPRLWKANKEPQVRVIADETFFPLPKYMNRFHSYPYMRIGVDIFPMYYLPKDINKQLELVTFLNDMQTTARYLDEYRKRGQLNSRLKQYEEKLNIEFDLSDDEILARNLILSADKYASEISEEESDLMCCTPYRKPPENSDKFEGFGGFKREWFGEGVKLPFENYEVTAPKDYTEVLISQFGTEYMIPQKFTGDHNYPFYQTQEEAFRKLLKESGINNSVDEFCRNWHQMNGGT